MKKILCLVLALSLALCAALALAESEFPEVELMTYKQYAEAEVDDPVYVETYVQATQSWWDNKITVYGQSEDGAIFIYNMTCTEEDAAKLVPGTKIAVKGYKAEWAGEVEIAEGATFEIVEGDPFIAKAADVTDLLGKDELVSHQNELVSFKGLTVEAYDETGAAFAYKNAENKTDDLYFKVSKDGQVYDFCVEFYLCGNDTDVYKAVEALKVGDVIDVEGFLYWYNGANPHITSVTKAK
jgi:regulator of RNase E activity RraB